MKSGKLLWWLLGILLVLFVIAIIVNNSNKTKIASAVANQNPANPNAVGRFLAASSEVDRSEIYNGKPVWLWVGRGLSSSGYVKTTSGPDTGWSVLEEYLNSAKTAQTCITRSNAPGHPCIEWRDDKGNVTSKA